MTPSRRSLRVVASAAALLFAAGCGSVGEYAFSRLSDLTDVGHLDLSFLCLGLRVNVGPLMLASETMIIPPDGPAEQLRLGLGGPQHVKIEGEAGGLLWPFERERVVKRKYGPFVPRVDPYEGSYYWEDVPAWGSIGLNLGVFGGLGVTFDVVELADFLVGFFGWDLVGDDLVDADHGPGSHYRSPWP